MGTVKVAQGNIEIIIYKKMKRKKHKQYFGYGAV